MLSDHCLSYLSVTLVYCGLTVGRIKTKHGMQVGLGPGHIVLDEDTAPHPRKGHSLQFSAHICGGQMAAWIKMTLGMEVGLSPGDCVRWGPSPLPKKAVEPPPQFSAHFYCGQMAAGCIKMPLGMVVGLSPVDFVLNGDPAPSPKRGQQPNFQPMFIVPNGCMDQDATWYGGRPRPRQHCVR